MFERSTEVATGSESVVDDQRNAMVMSYLGNGLDIRNVVARIADSFDVNGLGLLVDGLG